MNYVLEKKSVKFSIMIYKDAMENYECHFNM